MARFLAPPCDSKGSLRLSCVIKMACINFSIGLHCEHTTFDGWLEAQRVPKQKTKDVQRTVKDCIDLDEKATVVSKS